MGDVNAAAETIREALQYGYSLMVTGSPGFRAHKDARAALAALVAEVEQLRAGIEERELDLGKQVGETVKAVKEAEQLRAERDAAERALKLHVCPTDFNDLTDPPVESPDPGVDSGEEGDSLCQATTPESPASCVRCEQAIDALRAVKKCCHEQDWYADELDVITEIVDAALVSLGEKP